MARKQERIAHLYCVPFDTSESTLGSVLNKSNQSDYCIRVSELKHGVAVLKISGSGMYYTIYLIMTKVKVKGPGTCYSAAYMSRVKISSALQSRKWQLISMR